MAGRYDLVIVGMGSAGLVAAEFAARLELRVAAVEADLVLAIRKGMRLRKLLELVHVYPTIATSVSRLAGDAATANALRYSWLMRKES